MHLKCVSVTKCVSVKHAESRALVTWSICARSGLLGTSQETDSDVGSDEQLIDQSRNGSGTKLGDLVCQLSEIDKH